MSTTSHPQKKNTFPQPHTPFIANFLKNWSTLLPHFHSFPLHSPTIPIQLPTIHFIKTALTLKLFKPDLVISSVSPLLPLIPYSYASAAQLSECHDQSAAHETNSGVIPDNSHSLASHTYSINNQGLWLLVFKQLLNLPYLV